MARIAGVDIPRNKRGAISLTYIYGVGRSRALKILIEAGVDSNKNVDDWSDEEVGSIRNIIGSSFKVEGELRSETQSDIKRLMDIGCYRGIRHRNGLPLRGQRTKNNSRTRKGRRKTVANKKES
ncbi:MAG: 30S ribosomal protein S13 [Flavobacteriales bacterium]|jgi:small subunit ribosomal protein S13|nr:30S ribosomal protein S13 [Flavobacteriales bacterium]MBT7651763.1 30S ribosomal protein S13 [Flavobacteriales bacterium]MDE0722126.1 30S ribosomal protein S13 [Flavobacteriales bacterium]|tara:strand:+ start:36 stop:407 length:372 start_codon:yes stop_codon:yes gene_type:complete